MSSEAGFCPNCGSDAINYGPIEDGDECVFYPAECEDCGHTYRECYMLTFVGTEDDDGTWHDADEDDYDGPTMS